MKYRKLLFAFGTVLIVSGLSMHHAFSQEPCIPLARQYYLIGDFTKAITILKSCPAEDTSAAYTELLASSLFQSGDMVTSNTLVTSIPDSVSSVSLINLRARIAFARGEYHKAFQYYSQLVTIDTLNTGFIRQLALCADKLDSTRLAITWYKKALDLNPYDLVSGIRLTEVLYYSEELEQAEQISAKLVTVDSVPSLLRLRGELLYRLRKYDEAWSCFEPLLKMGTSDAEMLKKAGVCQFARGETNEAITMLSTSYLIKPNDEITCYYLGMAYESKGDFRNSELYLKAAISNGISQNLGSYYYRLGSMYETSGDYEKALEALKTSLAYRTSSNEVKPEIYSEIGRLYEVYFNDYKNALIYYNYFLKAFNDTSTNQYKGIKSRKEELEKKIR